MLGESQALQDVLTEGERRFVSPAAELVRRQADGTDIPFEVIQEANLVIFLASTLPPRVWWRPQTALYAEYGYTFPLFMNATRHRDYEKLAAIADIADGIDYEH